MIRDVADAVADWVLAEHPALPEWVHDRVYKILADCPFASWRPMVVAYPDRPAVWAKWADSAGLYEQLTPGCRLVAVTVAAHRVLHELGVELAGHVEDYVRHPTGDGPNWFDRLAPPPIEDEVSPGARDARADRDRHLPKHESTGDDI